MAVAEIIVNRLVPILACLLPAAVVLQSAHAGEIEGRREGMFGGGVHESFIWAVGVGANSTSAYNNGFSWLGNYTIGNLPSGQYWVVASEHGASPYNFIPHPVSVGSGTTTLDIHDWHTMSSVGLTDLGICTWAAQSFVATGRDLAQFIVISPSGGSQVYATIREGTPTGPQIGPGRNVTNGSLFPAGKRYDPGEVPLVPGRRYVLRFDGSGTDSWRPALGYTKDPYPNGHAWIDGEPIPEADLSVSITCRDTGFIDGYRVNNWWRSNTYAEYVQTFVADGSELRLASLMLAGDVGHEEPMRASAHEWNGRYPYGSQVGVAKHAEMGANVTHAFVWGPGECPLTLGETYAIRFVRVDGQPFPIYGDSDKYSRGRAYFDGSPENGIDVTGRLVFTERDRPNIIGSGITLTPISATEVLATAHTSVPTFATVAYRIGSPVFDTIVPSRTQNISHTMTVHHLKPNTTYQMWILAYNAGYDVFESSPVTVATLNETAALAGRVTTQYGPAAGIEVILDQAGLTTFTDSTGHFHFADAPTGMHTLRVQDVGIVSTTREVDVTTDGQSFVHIVTTAYSNQFANSDDNPMAGWTAFGQFSGQFDSGQFDVSARTGSKWVGSVGNWSPKTGGLWRVVATTPGETYRFGAFLQTRAFHDSNPDDLMPGLAVARIGIDTSGGIDPDAPTVEWMRYRFTDEQWLEQSVEFEATGTATTLFLKHKYEDFYRLPPWYIAAFDDMWFGQPLPTTPDFDRDGDIDQTDFGHFQACLTGAGNAQNDPDCADARLDKDEDVDADDFGIFQACMSGAGQPFNPSCVELD